MKRKACFLFLLLGICPTAVSVQSTATSLKPHIVMFVSDDMGWNEVGYHGSKIATPNIDRLAKDGIQLNRFYVHPICSPTRTALMTGRLPARMGITGVIGRAGSVPRLTRAWGRQERAASSQRRPARRSSASRFCCRYGRRAAPTACYYRL